MRFGCGSGVIGQVRVGPFDGVLAGVAGMGGVVPVGLGLVAELAAHPDDGDGGIGQAGEVAGQLAGADAAAVLVVGDLDGSFPGCPDGSVPHDVERLTSSRQGRHVVVEPVQGNEGAGPRLKPPMPLVHGVEGGGGVPIEGLEVVQQFLAVGLHRHDVVGPLVDNQTGRFRAAVQGVERQCAAGDVQLGDEPPRPEDLPAGAVRCSLPHHDAAAVLHRGQEHTGIVRSARTVERGGLPVEGQDPFRGLCQ